MARRMACFWGMLRLSGLLDWPLLDGVLDGIGIEAWSAQRNSKVSA